jgi:hypothetical protein
VIASFCDLSNQTWTEVMIDFGTSTLLIPTAIDKELLRIKVESALHFTLATVQTSLTRSLLTIQRTTAGNGFVSGLFTNFDTYLTPLRIGGNTDINLLPKKYGNCTCSNINGCPRSSYIINSQGDLFLIPGIVSDCLIVDGILASTLECFYDDTCLSQIYQQIDTTIDPLLISANKHFTPNTTVQFLLNELMIDELSSDINFISFYNQCNPYYCSYTFHQRFNIFYIITTIIAIFGGLSFILRLIAPLMARIILYCKNRSTENDPNNIS